jgi:hypothetical protein
MSGRCDRDLDAFILSGSPEFTSRKPAGMSMLDAGTGAVLSTFSLRGYPVAAAVYEPAGRLFVATSIFWTPELAMRDVIVVPSATAMIGHLAFFMDAGGRITVLNVRNGHVLSAVDTGVMN